MVIRLFFRSVSYLCPNLPRISFSRTFNKLFSWSLSYLYSPSAFTCEVFFVDNPVRSADISVRVLELRRLFWFRCFVASESFYRL